MVDIHKKSGDSAGSQSSPMSGINAEGERRHTIAKRLSSLPDEKRKLLSARLAEEGIDIWQLPIVATEIQKPKLSSEQQRLWFLDKTKPGNTLYNLFFGLHFYGDLNVDGLEKSLNLIVERHDALRTNIKEEDDRVYQDVQPFSELTIHCEDLDVLVNDYGISSDLELEEKLSQLAKCEADMPFDLESDTLFRFSLVKISSQHHLGIFTVHHIIFDAYSVENFCIELSQSYRGLAVSEEVALPQLSIQYRDYAVWQQRWLESEHCDKQLAYWQKQLADLPQPLGLSIANADVNKERLHLGAERSIVFPKALSHSIIQLAKKKNSTLYMVMLAMFNVLLSRYSDTQDICIGTSVANRDRLETEGLIGFFVNLLVMRNQVDEACSFDEFLDSVNTTATDAYAHQDLPFDKLADVSRHQGRELSSLFQVLFVMNNAGLDTELSLPNLTIRPYEKPIERARYDLTLRVYEQSLEHTDETALRCNIEYDTSLYTDAAIEIMLSHYQQLFQSLFDKSSTASLSELDLLSASEKEQQASFAKGPSLLFSSISPLTETSTNTIDAEQLTLQSYFESQALSNPNALALIYESEQLNYGELNERANRLAHYLRDRGIGRESRVGLYLERSVFVIESILAVLKAGATYVPLDVQWPANRIEHILADADISLVLSETPWREDLDAFSHSLRDIIYLGEAEEDLSTYPSTNPEAINTPSDSAYVIYTSGSTGLPKGVVVEHRQILNYSHAMTQRLGLHDRPMRFGHISTVAADLGNTSLFGALCFGGSLQLISTERAFDADAVAEQLAQYPVDVLKIVPGHLQGLLSAEHAKDLLPKDCLILGGEACSVDLIKHVRALSPTLKIVNHYGPTETTVGVLTHEVSAEDLDSNLIPIGRPLANCQTYVLDRAQQLSPVGIAGELYVGGANVTRGYLNDPEQTDARFIESPFGEGRLYRTGDRVKRNDAGELIFLGRVDNQVKVRGYRVELGDIESALVQQGSVKEAVVRLNATELSDQLVAYVVLDSEIQSGSEDARNITTNLESELGNVLPDYMLPQRIHLLDAVPRTANGKVDFSKLDALAGEKKANVRRSPRNDIEQILLEVWQQVLNRNDICIDDNFFALGGDSILSLQVIARAKRAGIKITPKQFFEKQCIAELSEVTEKITAGTSESYELVSGDVALSPIQRWFFESGHTQAQHWNQSFLLQAKQQIDIDALSQAISLVVGHHDQLRAEFTIGSLTNQYEQRICTWDELSAKQYLHTEFWLNEAPDCEEERESYFVERVNSWQASLTLESRALESRNKVAQLFKLVFFPGYTSTQDKDEKSLTGIGSDHAINDRLLIVAHHLLIDGVSWRILLEDLNIAYQYCLQPAVVRSKKCPLPGKTASFKQWSEALSLSARQSDARWYQHAWSYWQEIARKVDSCKDLVLPESHTYTLGDIKRSDHVLDSETTSALLKDAPKAYQTGINDLLISALVLAFAKQKDIRNFLVELEGHGRENLDSVINHNEGDDGVGFEKTEYDVSRTVGWFTSRFPLLLKDLHVDKIDSVSDEDLANLIKSVKEQLNVVPSNGMSYGVLLYLGDLPVHPMPMISFNYLGQVIERSEHALFEAIPKDGDIIERSLDNTATHGLSINAIVTDGKLSISWQYISDLLGFDVAKLTEDYQIALCAIVKHCGNTIRAYTPTDFPLAELNQSQLDNLVHKVGLEKIQDIYPLTPMQEGLMLHTLLAPKSGIYFMQYRYQLRGHFDHEAFSEAWRMVVARHEILRTAFIRQDDISIQVVHRDAKSPVDILDWRQFSEDEQAVRLAELMQNQVEQSFDLTRPTQLSITLIRIEDEKYQLIRSFHHILMDAWCFGLLLNDFLYFYQALIQKHEPSLPQPKRYREYVGWLNNQSIENTEAYWQKMLTGFEAPTPLVIDTPQDQTGVKDHLVWLSEEQTTRLHEVAKRSEITVNTIVQGAWGLVLSRYSSNSDVVFGVTVAGRPTEMDDADTIIGLFINSLPLRVNAEQSHSVEQYLKEILALNHSMREHEFTPLADIQRLSDIEPGRALFDSLFVYENAPVEGVVNNEVFEDKKAAANSEKLDFELIDSDNRTHTNYPITVVVYPKQNLGLQLTFDRAKFADEAVARMLKHFECAVLNLAEALEAEPTAPARKLKDVEILSDHEQRQVLIDWNQTFSDYPRQRCWQELFVDQVKETPNAVAVACNEKLLSYEELYVRSLSVAQHLIHAGVGADDVVGVLDQREIDLLVSIIGVLLAGAAYLPLDPKYPEQRLAQVLTSSEINTVLTGKAYQELILSALAQTDSSENKTKLRIIVAEDTVFNQPLDQQNTQSIGNLDTSYSPDNLAYVIYTSGSTGTPKGAMIEHRGMLNNVYAKISQLSLTKQDVIAQTASQCFDISVWQFLTALICGAQIRIFPDDIAHDPSALLSQIERHGVTVLESVPSLIHSFIDFGPAINTLRWLIPTGEALTTDLTRRWLTQYPHIPLMNAYGPAECSDDVAMWPIHSAEEAQLSSIPIGTPTDNNRLFVLSPNQKPQPIGIPGEIYVAGAGVGRGYLNDPERSAPVFIYNILLEHPCYLDTNLSQFDQPKRLYRTGDLGRWRADGVLEYLGRTDHQVKIRGYRIELGEIEAAIEAYDMIYLAAALVKTDPRGDQCIVAYYQTRTDYESAKLFESTSISTLTPKSIYALEEEHVTKGDDSKKIEEDLRLHLATVLPAYMVPNSFVRLATIPVNDNGKIDRQQLPEPNFSYVDERIEEPRNDIERQLVDLWQEVLKIDRIDIHSNFFALGGHSLLAIRLHAKVCQSFSVDLPLRSVFERNSVAEVAEQIELARAVDQLVNEPLASDTVDEQGFEEFDL